VVTKREGFSIELVFLERENKLGSANDSRNAFATFAASEYSEDVRAERMRRRLKLLVQFLVFFKDINLVDPASSHTLVSKIKPCMSKYKQFCTVKLRMAHYISYSLLDSTLLLG
jgi:hypothetical protein